MTDRLIAANPMTYNCAAGVGGRSAARRLALILAFLGFFLTAGGVFEARADEEAEMAPPQTATETIETQPAAELEPGAEEAGEPEMVRGVSFYERLQQGGWPMLFLLVLSVSALTFALERAINLRREAVLPMGLTERAKQLWAAGKYDELTDECRRRPSTLGAIIQTLVRHRHCGYLELSSLSGDLAARDMRHHLQKSYPIAVVATLSPLVGLLGTVIGMIESFEIVAIAGSLGDASLLAGGISMALVTTATGLVIAAPALAVYHFFRTRANRFAISLEGEVNELLTSWFLEPEQELANSERMK